MSTDHYRTLNVAADAEAEVVRAAYLALMRKHHPDKVGQDAAAQARAKEISAAFAILGDPDRRAAYDRQRASAGPPRPSTASSRAAAPSDRRPAPSRGPTLSARRRRLNRVRWASIGLFLLAVGLVAAGTAGVMAQIG